MAEDLATLLAVCEKASQSKFPVTIDPVAVLPVVRRAADLIEQQAASLESAEKSYNVAVQRSLYWRNRAEQAERALAEATEVLWPFVSNEVDGALMMTRSHVQEAVAAARAFVAQHGSDSREGK